MVSTSDDSVSIPCLVYSRTDFIRLHSANIILNTLLPVLTMAVTFAFYTAVQKKELTAATGTLLTSYGSTGI